VSAFKKSMRPAARAGRVPKAEQEEPLGARVLGVNGSPVQGLPSGGAAPEEPPAVNANASPEQVGEARNLGGNRTQGLWGGLDERRQELLRLHSTLTREQWEHPKLLDFLIRRFGPMTLAEVGIVLAGIEGVEMISRERIRQLEERAMKKVRARAKGLAGYLKEKRELMNGYEEHGLWASDY